MKYRVSPLLQAIDPNRHPVVFQFLVGGLGLLLLITLLGFSLMVRRALSAQTVNRAAIVIVFGSGNTHQQCVEFTGDEISGLDMLQQTGLDLVVDASNAIGAAVCKIRRNGCDYPAEGCFCKCQGPKCEYWSYWTGDARGNWTYSSMGTANRVLHNGDVDGWVWGVGTTSSASPPPAVTFEQICGPQAGKATMTPTATQTLTEAPTATNAPPTATRTSLPSRTPTMTRTPTETRLPTSTFEPTIERAVPTRRIIQNSVPQPTLPPEPTAEFVPTPFIEENQPLGQRATSTRPPALLTRVAIVSGNATRAAEELQLAEAAEAQSSGIDIHLVSGIALVGGMLVGGAGLVVLLGGAAWYVTRRR